MKKLFTIAFIAIVLLFSNSNSFAQLAYKYELNNIIQISECEFRFDVYITNMSPTPAVDYIAIEGAQFQVYYSPTILNGGAFNNTFCTFVAGTSDFDPLSTSTYPVSTNVTSVPAGIQWVNNTNNPGEVLVYLDNNTPKRIGTFKVLLKLTSASTINKNFASASPAFALVPSGCVVSTTPATLTDVSIDQDGSLMRYTRDGSTFTTITNQTLANQSGVKPLYSYAFTGTGPFTDPLRWNNGVTASGTSYHLVPTLATDNISFGALSTASIPVVQPGVCTLSSNQTFNDVSIRSTSSLTVNAGTQLSVNGTLYKDNVAATALTLKSDATGTASLKNNTAGVTATIERYIPGWGTNVGWHLLSSPVANQAIAPNFIDGTAANYDFFKWDVAGNIWRNQKVGINNITNFIPGVGYLASYSTAGTHTFTGIMNTGDLSPALIYNAAATYNLIGNPYACALDGSISTWTQGNIAQNTVYVLDGVNAYTYKSWNGTTGTLTNGEIPAMQGFWVKTNANPTITIPVTAKKHSSSNFYKTTLDNQLKLSVLSPNATSDVSIIYFKNDNSNGVDLNDGSYMVGGNPLNTQIYSYINSDKYCINALAEYAAPIEVNVGFEPKVDGNFTITAGEILSFNSASTIILQDLKTGATQDLRQNATYNFTATTADAISRFKILFDLAIVGINDMNTAADRVYSFENNIYVKTSEKVKSVSVYNMLGQEVENIQLPASKIVAIHQAGGYYTVRVVTENNVYSQKVYIK